MRSSKTRSRGKNNRSRFPSNNGGNLTNRVFDSSGPEGKVRGTPQQIIDKYNQLMRDAQLSNDRVAAENFAQHSEHYTRLLAENMREIEERRESQEAQNRDRQAQRDSERTDRFERQETQAAGTSPIEPPVQSAPTPVAKPDTPRPYVQPDLGSGPQPDLLDTSTDNSGLVDTPEAKPRKVSNRPPRKPRTENPVAAPVDGAEPASEKPKRAPRRRKPIEKNVDAGTPASEAAPRSEPTGE
ncbi:DUF4167 domain-containing protein [Falsihalocynthiibacter sp. S25ZX9]|uniref:DUF4167 domain-containing protein n=1 Tax=Falsihalocynthiibacter sp. S25ZX9 TaxID=3240870 RepID=UPI00351021FA